MNQQICAHVATHTLSRMMLCLFKQTKKFLQLSEEAGTTGGLLPIFSLLLCTVETYCIYLYRHSKKNPFISVVV